VEEDYSQYENAAFTDVSAKRYCSPKIFDLSPQRFISVAWDAQLPYNTRFSVPGRYAPDQKIVSDGETAKANYTGGLRVSTNIPVLSRNNIVWQMGANFWDVRYRFGELVQQNGAAGLTSILENQGLRTLGLNTTVFKPLSETTFLLFQGSADLSGNYTWANFQSLRYLRYSAAAIWGRRPHDRKQWGVGLSQTYRVGEMNFIPVFLFNYTAPNRRWGTEILFPARAHVRRTFNPRNLLLVGYELEGQSYRLYRYAKYRPEDLEIRRGEIRLRMVYECSLKDFIWLSVQAGYRINYRYDVDRLENGNEIYRAFGLLSKEPYVMANSLTNPLYFNISINLVSP
jgi:hypothetical protein